MDDRSSGILQHLEKLSVEIGPRPIGSPANQAAADYIREVFRSLGWEVEQQPYACTAWEHASTSLEVDGRPVPAAANAFSLPCEVAAPVVPVSTVADLERAEITGKIALLYGDLACIPISPKSWFLKTGRDEQIIHLLETKRPAALLAPPAATVEYEQVTEDWELDLSAATIPADTARLLILRPGTSVRLVIQSRRVPATARNILARRPGRGPEKVVLCAHFDTKIDTPGAMDNAAGAAALLELAEATRQADFPFGLELVAFNGEEYLPMGDDEYLRHGLDSFDRILAAINLDGVGAVMGSNSIAIYSASQAFQEYVREKVLGHTGLVWVEPWPESNHSTFAFRGVPSLALSSVGVRHLAHLPADTIDQTSPYKILEAAVLVTEIVEGLSGRTVEWTRERQ